MSPEERAVFKALMEYDAVMEGFDDVAKDDPERLEKYSALRWKAMQTALAQARAEAFEEHWQPIETAPKDGTPVLLLFRDRIPNDRADVRMWDGLAFVGRNYGNVSEWCFAAPVGMGGFPDDWLAGWMPLPIASAIREKAKP